MECDAKPCSLPDWEDDDRMSALFRPLPPPGQQGPVRASRLLYWKQAVHAWACYNKAVTFTLQDLLQAFTRKHQQPQCLKEVVEHLIGEGSIVPSGIVDSLYSRGDTAHPQSWMSWGSRLLLTPPKWVWSRLIGAPLVQDGDMLVDVKLLKTKSKELYDTFWKRTTSPSSGIQNGSQVRSVTQLLEEVGDVCGATALSLCLGHLQHEQLLLCDTRQNASGVTVVYVKFTPPGNILGKEAKLSSSEIAEVEMAAACKLIQRRVDELSSENDLLKQQAKDAVKLGSKAKALQLLRRRRRVASSLEGQLTALDNAMVVLEQLRQAHLNTAIVTAFRSAALALRESVRGDQSADAVVKTMDQVQEVLEECHEVSEALSSSLEQEEGSDEQLEAELEALLAENESLLRVSHTTADLDDVLPSLAGLSIPTHDPSSPAVATAMSELNDLALPQS